MSSGLDGMSVGVGVLGGLIAGLGLGVLMAGSPASSGGVPSTERPPPLAPMLQPRPTSLTQTPASPASPMPPSEVDVVRLQREISLYRGQLQLLGALPLDWPEDLDPRYRREVLDPWIEEVVGEVEGVALGELDCREYPCAAVLRYDPDLSASTEHINVIRERFLEEFEGSEMMVMLVDSEDGTSVMLTFQPEGAREDPALGKRLQLRQEELMEPDR